MGLVKIMSVYDIFNKMYKHAVTDEKLMRLLFYVAEHRDDDVTIKTDARPNIVGDFDVINQVVKICRPNEGDLLPDNAQCVLYIYLGEFENSVMVNTGTVNPTSFYQYVNLDAYVHEDYQNTGFALAKIVDRLLALFNQVHVGGVGAVKFMTAAKLDDVDKYEGMQIKLRNMYTQN